MDWSWLIGFEVSPWELIARGTLMYWFLFLVFRFLLRRDVGGLGVADVLLVVLVADASQNAMTAGYHSVGEGTVLVSTLIGWNYLLDLLAFHFPMIERFVEARPLPLVRRGRVIRKNLRAEYITMDELWSHLRQNGIESLDQVKSACLEGDGQLSVVRSDGSVGGPKTKNGGPGSS